MVTGGGDTRIESWAAAVSGVGEAESVASTWKLYRPSVLVVPEIRPVVDKESPGGSAPVSSRHE